MMSLKEWLISHFVNREGFHGFRSLLSKRKIGGLEEWASKTGKTFCSYCGYTGEEIQGECPDLDGGIYCPKCHEGFPIVVEKVA